MNKKGFEMSIKKSLFICGLFVISAVAHAQNGSIPADENTKALFSQYLSGQKQTLGDFDLQVESYGGIKRILAFRKGLQPSIPSIYFLDSKGGVGPATAETLVELINRERAKSLAAKEYDQIAGEGAKLLLSLSEVIITNTAAIPGYSSNPAGENVNLRINSPTKIQANQLVKTIFTYAQMGGEIIERRFIFADRGGLVRVESEVLAKGVGNVRYLE